MPSRSEGWGGLFKDEQYRLISALRDHIKWLRIFEQTTPALRACPSLLRREWAGRGSPLHHFGQPAIFFVATFAIIRFVGSSLAPHFQEIAAQELLTVVL